MNSALKLLCVTCSRTVDSAWFCPWFPGACAAVSTSDTLAQLLRSEARKYENAGRHRRAGKRAVATILKYTLIAAVWQKRRAGAETYEEGTHEHLHIGLERLYVGAAQQRGHAVLILQQAHAGTGDQLRRGRAMYRAEQLRGATADQMVHRTGQVTLMQESCSDCLPGVSQLSSKALLRAWISHTLCRTIKAKKLLGAFLSEARRKDRTSTVMNGCACDSISQ